MTEGFLKPNAKTAFFKAILNSVPPINYATTCLIYCIGSFLYVLRCVFWQIPAIICLILHYVGNFQYVLRCIFRQIYAIIIVLYYSQVLYRQSIMQQLVLYIM